MRFLIFSSRKHATRVLVLFILMIVAALGAAGCQVDVSGAIGAKAFYPNKAGGKDKDVGDPRTGMYDGSGYGERHSAGSDGGTEHFKPLKGGE